NFHGKHAQGVAIGFGAGNGLVAHDTVAAHAVNDIDRVAQFLFQQRADDAGSSVGTATGRPRHDQGDGALGPGGGCRSRSKYGYSDSGDVKLRFELHVVVLRVVVTCYWYTAVLRLKNFTSTTACQAFGITTLPV